jgi:hypothetical protein
MLSVMGENPMKNEDIEKTSSRTSIIEAVQKPINFFALVVLVVEVILGITANLSQGIDRTYLIIGMLILIFALVIIVSIFAFFRPEALSGRRPTLKIQKQEIEEIKPQKVKLIDKPSFLFTASQQQYIEFIENDIKIIKEQFPKRKVKITKSVSSTNLREILCDEHYDIIHLIINVDTDGTLIFSKEDRMTSEAFAKLIETSGASLVVLAVCDSLPLAAKIARTSNMIAAIEKIQDKDIIEWEHIFYKLLSRGQSLSRSYDLARATTNAQMVLLLKEDFAINASNE